MPNHAGAPKAFTSLVGEKLGDLEFIELIAEGALTAVYRARQPALNRQVAVKVLSPDEALDPSQVERFTRAALAAAAVEHPNIVQVFYAAEQRGYHYVVMELVHGEDLAALLKREGRLSADQALSLMKQATAALAAAHAAGVLHGDIQPSNLIVTQAGQLKVADFSLARCTASDTGPAAASTPPSKPLYFPPEAARGRRLDARSDLYLLGCTFYHALAGRPPFDADTPEALALKHVREDPRPLHAAAPKAPPAFCHLIHLLLSKNPNERFQKAEDLLGALERIEGELEAGRRPPPAPTATEPAPRAAHPDRRRLWGALALGALAAIALIGYAVLRRGRREPQSHEHVATEAPVAPGKPEPKVTTEAPPRSPILEPGKAEPKVEPEAPAWERAWAEAAGKAKALAEVGRFGEAIACYGGVAEGRSEMALRVRVAAAKAELTQGAERAYSAAAARAQQLAAEKQFAAARAELQGIVERSGVASVLAEARKLAAAIEARERAANAEATPANEAAARAAELAREQEADARATRAIAPFEALAKGWNFAAAAAGAARLQDADPGVAARLATRADQFARLAKLKGKMIQRILTANPKLLKSSISMTGLNGPLTGADEQAIVVGLGKDTERTAEKLAWPDLSDRAARALALLALDRNSGDDWLALALLDLATGNLAAAEEDLAKGRALKADVSRHMAPLAQAGLGRVGDLLAKQDFRWAAAALDALDAAYGDTPWLKLRRDEVAALRTRVKLGLAEAEADSLLGRAAECRKKGDPYEARRLLTALKKDHPASKAVTDAGRKPSFAELDEAVAALNLGRFIAVRKDGTGDAKSIAEAIQAATAKTRIEVQDSETYAGRLVIPEAKAGLHLRAKAGCLPVVTAADGAPDGALVEVRAEQVTIEGIVLVLGNSKSPVRDGRTLWVRAGPLQLRQAILTVAPARGATKALSIESDLPADCDLQGCLVAGSALLRGSTQARDTLWLAGRLKADKAKLQGENLVLVDGAELNGPADLRSCTIPGSLTLRDGPNALRNSILSSVDSARPNTEIDHCLLFPSAALGGSARLDRTSSFGTPQFTDKQAFDFRLRPKSPGRGAAPDRDDLGCRYSPAMLELLKQALELRRKGILAF